MLQTILSALRPFGWGGALALFLNLPMKQTELGLRRLPPKLRRGLALLLVLLGLAAVLLLASWLLLPQFFVAVRLFAEELPRLGPRLQEAAGRLFPHFAQSALPELLARVDDAGLKASATLADTLLTGVLNAADTAGSMLVALVLAVYLLADKEHLCRSARRFITAAAGPNRAAALACIARHAGETFTQFLAGQCIEACILAGLFVLVLFVFRIPSVLPIAAVIGITALVPIFGSFVGCAVGVALILPQSPAKAGWFVLLFLCVQQLENNLIYPRVVGSRVGLPPLWVLGAVVLGGGLCGLSGLLLGIPAAGVVYHLGSDWVQQRLEQQSNRDSAGGPGPT